MSEYADRDIIGQGAHYIRHVSAMTTEGLHSKSDIAAELAHRDIEIERLRAEVEALRTALRDRCIEVVRNAQTGSFHRVCDCCKASWEIKTSERHAPDCLAAPKEGER